MKKPLALLFVALCVVLNTHAQTLWKKVLPFPLTWGIYAMFEDTTDHSAYMAGGFTTVNGTPCNMMKWDGGSSFTTLPPSPLYNTFCITKYKGKIYAGGYGLACWDGNSWTTLDNNAAVTCFYHYQDKLLVGGVFDNIGGSTHGTLAAWNDTSWSGFLNIDSLFGTGSGWQIASVTEYKGKVYIGGNFNGLPYDTTINDIAVYNGQKWTNLAGQLPSTSLAFVKKLLVWNDTLYVAGDFNEGWGCPGNGIASWDGQNWHKLGNGVLGGTEPFIGDMVVNNNALYCVGGFSIVDGINLGYYGTGYKSFVKWDGHKWCTLNTVSDNGIGNLFLFRDTIYGAGNYWMINNDSMRHLAKWVGGNYSDSCSLGKAGITGSELRANSFEVYPNPAQNYINVKTTLRSTNMIFSLCDITGKTLLQQSVTDNARIDINALSPGIYLYRVTVEGILQKTGKVLKQ